MLFSASFGKQGILHQVMKRNEGDRPESSALDVLFSPVEASSIVFFRVVFGLMMAFSQLKYILGGDLESHYLEVNLLFKYTGFEWVRAGSETVLYLVFWGLFVLALGIAFGFLYRISTVGFLLLYTYFFLLDQATYNNHYYLVILISFMLIFVPAHRSSSVDALIDPQLRKAGIPLWALWLLRFHVALPYFFGGLAKINYDWLARAQPMKLWLTTGGIEEAYRFEIMNEPWTAYFFCWGGLVFDLLIVPLLLIRRTRLVAFVFMVGFHLNNAFMFNIGFFPWLMIPLTMIFFAPDWPRRVGWFRREDPAKKPPPKKEKRSTAGQARPNRRLVAVLLAAYVGLQCLLPFRHLLYPGRVDWSEEGQRFSWRMKLRDKRGEVRFIAVDPETRQAQVLQGHEKLLTGNQRLMLTHSPEMMRQFAHFLAEKFRKESGKNLQIRVHTSISLNGHERQPLIDPEVDLAATHASVFLPAHWILPFED